MSTTSDTMNETVYDAALQNRLTWLLHRSL